MTDRDVRRWETLDRHLAHRCSAFDVYTEDVRLPDGTAARFDYVSEPPSAVVLPFTAEGEVVVTREYRHAVGRVALGLPGGSREAADGSLEATARRELREETGYLVEGALTPLLVAEPANGLLDSERHYFRAGECVRAAEVERDPNETIAIETLPYTHLLDRVRTGAVRDERTVTAVLFHHLADE